MRNIELKIAGVVYAGLMSLILFIQIQFMRMDPASGVVPSYFFDLTQLFSVAIFLLGFGCIYKSMSGVGVIFTGFQIFILTSLVMGMPSVFFVAPFIIASLVFLDVSQTLVFLSEACEPVTLAPDAVRERHRIDAYIQWISPVCPQARLKLDSSKRTGIRMGMSRLVVVWAAVLLASALAFMFITDEPLAYISLLFFVIFPMSIVALVLQRRTIEKGA